MEATDLNIDELAAAIEEFNGVYIRLPTVQRLSFTTLSVLHTLSRRSPLRLGELTATEQVTQSAITQLVTRLERDGLVERRPDPRDGRAVLVHITPAGSKVVAARRTDRVSRLTPVVDRLPADERAAIAAALPALRHLASLADAAGLAGVASATRAADAAEPAGPAGATGVASATGLASAAEPADPAGAADL